MRRVTGKNSRNLLTEIFVATAVTGLISIASAADTYTDSNGDVYTYQVDKQGINISVVKDNGDGKMVVPGKISNAGVYSFTAKQAGLSVLDVSQCTELTYLNVSGYVPESSSENINKLTSLDVSKNTKLEYLYCDINQLTRLDVRNNTKLKELDCDQNRLTSLDVSKNTALTKLWFFANKISKIDLSKNLKLTELACWSNQLTSLDVSKNTDLTNLYCYNNNQLASLDVSKNTKLERLECGGDLLTSLDLSNNHSLMKFNIIGLDLEGSGFMSTRCATNIKTVYLSGTAVVLELNVPNTVTVYKGGKLYRAPATPTPTPTLTSTPTPTEEPTVVPTEAEAPTSQNTDTPAADINGEPIIDNGIIYTINSKAEKTVTIKKYQNTKAKVSIPATVKINNRKYKVTQIADKAFSNNKKLKQITIGKNVASISKDAFRGCSGLKTVTIKSKILKKVGANAFKGIAKKAVFKIPKSKAKKYQTMLKKVSKGTKITYKKI